MSNRDPRPSFNPTAGSFRPASTNANKNQMSPSPDLQVKVEDLEREQTSLRTEVDGLKALCSTLDCDIDTLKKGGWAVRIGPFKGRSASPAERQKALQDLIAQLPDGTNGVEKKDHKSLPPSSSSVPQCINTKTSIGPTAFPDHPPNGPTNGSVSFRPVCWSGTDSSSASGKKSNANNALITDGKIDPLDTEPYPYRSKKSPAETTPPSSPATIKRDMERMALTKDVEALSLSSTPNTFTNYKPKFIASLPDLPSEVQAKIPPPSETVSFSSDFLLNTFGGYTWGPGIRFVPPPTLTTLPNRVYYTVDAHLDPHLPPAPGHHGAKLVPFFNDNPEDSVDYDFPDDFNSAANVPLFVLRDVPDPAAAPGATRKRYVYYGHYSQTRYSDKLDYDRMAQCVPPHVRAYWSEELSASGRPAWVTAALQKHFFPAPPYEGRRPEIPIEEGGSVAEEDVGPREEKVLRDVKKHVEHLRMWEKEARMRTSMIKKDFILTAFDQADADEPKALRLWWEYLECIDFRQDFYNMLVGLQSRDANYA